MVFYYTIRGGPCRGTQSHIVLSSEDITCYVGEDKHENEHLIKYGWPGDVWFHVDSLSSAHVYFRVNTATAPQVPIDGIEISNLPSDSVYDMMQIVKHNSISGCKLASTRIVYTPHSNLKKTFDMDVGQVSYHDTKKCLYARCDKDKERVKELERTKTERTNVDFFEEMKENERRIIARKKQEREKAREDRLYDPIKDDVNMTRKKAVRMGNDESGIENGLAALNSLGLGSGNVSISGEGGNMRGPAAAAGDGDGVEKGNLDTSPIWEHEAEANMSAMKSLQLSPTAYFLRSRGYAQQEIETCICHVENEHNIQIGCQSSSRASSLKALWMAFATSSDSSGNAADQETISVANPLAARQEEREVLEAIFGEDNGDGVVFSWRGESDTDDSVREQLFDVVLPVTAYEPPPRYWEGASRPPPPLLMEVYVDRGMAPLYPYQPPVLAFVGGGLPEKMLKELTHRLKVRTQKTKF
jgi:hypothetical protein